MNSPPLQPSRPLKWAAALLRALLWAVAGVWLLFALTWGAIHGIIVPRIGEWRPELETLATRAVGVPVRIGGIRAQTQGLIPSFELTDVRLLDAQGRDALVLGRVLTAVSVTSLWRLGFEQIHIDQPELDVRRLPDGRLEIAGLDLFQNKEHPDKDHQAADWFFSQNEFVIRSGKVHWTDDLRRQPTLTLDNVDLVARNPGRQHLLRLDATPAGGLSGRLSLRADMRSPFLTLHPGRWSAWTGTAYAELPTVNLARLASPTHLADWLGLKVDTGQGALRLWLDLEDGQVQASTADLALTGVLARFARAPQPLVLNGFSGRVSLQRRAQSWEVNTEHLAFETRTGQRWKQGQLRVQYQPLNGETPVPGEFEASHVSLTALHELGSGLPLPPAMQGWLAELRPVGTLETLRLNWVGNEQGWSRYAGRGKVVGLALAAETLPTYAAPGKGVVSTPGRPGFGGAAIDFDFNQEGGQARLGMAQGHLHFPGVFEEPVIPMERLSAEVRWRMQGDDIDAQFNNVRFANADLQGHASGSWRTSDPATSPSQARFPGVLKLDGTLSRGRGERVHRYLPLVIAADARAYVKASILGGQARDVRFHVAGDLWQMPFENPADGEFHIAAKVSQVDYAFVPPSWGPEGRPKWPALKQVDGELVFDRASMTLAVNKGGVADAPGLKVTKASARIADLSDKAVVEVQAQIEGPLSDALGVVNRSPLADMTGQALRQTRGTGSAAIQFGLSVPLANTDKTTVRGSVTLPGNDLQITPDSPLLVRTRGRVEFSDQGFQVTQGVTRLVGGELQFSGGLRVQDGGSHLQFKGQGQATAEGLRQSPFLGPLASVAERATGTTGYSIQLGLAHGQPEFAVQTNLQGLALDLPAPLNKAAEAAWPLRYSQQATAPAPAGATPDEEMSLSVSNPQGHLLTLELLRSPGSGTAPQVRGLVLAGSAPRAGLAMPAQGVTARIQWPQIDADAWDTLVTGTSHAGLVSELQSVQPQRVWLDTQRLTAGGRQFHDVTLDASRRGTRWQGRVQARELAGTLDYQPGTERQGAHLVARLDRLDWQTSNDDPTPGPSVAPQPLNIPSLDVEVAALELDGRDLGRLELQAMNRQIDPTLREWRLTRLNLKVPEAQLSATGNWVPVGATQGVGPSSAHARRTALNFKLEVQDSGALLARFGMPGVFRGGKGQLEGNLAWMGPPHAFHTPSLSGQLKLDVAAGQFLKADPGLAKLLGVLSLQSLPRRLALDFRDVFTQGFAFDFVRGDARVDHGVIATNNLQMKGPNAAVLMEGQADVGSETQDIRALVVPEINAGTASLIATVINPAVGLGSFLAQAILRQPLIQASTQAFRIHGTWTDPVVDRVSTPSALPAAASEAPSSATAP